MVKRRKWLPLMVGVATLLPYLVMFGRVIKSFQHALAVFVIICLSGILIYESLRARWLKFIYTLLLVLPFILGFRLYLPEQPHRGPGFSEIDPGKALTWEEKDQAGLGGFKIWQSPKLMIRGRGIRLTLGSGFPFPTTDGGRAFGGWLWCWVIDWKRYVESFNQAYKLLSQSQENDWVMGQYPMAAIAVYNLINEGYRPIYIYHRDYFFQKKDRVIRNYWYFKVFTQYIGKSEMSLEPLPKKVKYGLLVTFPSFAYRLETGELSIRGYTHTALGANVFRVKQIEP